MDKFQIETAQNVSINQQVANLSTRIFAYLIDLLILTSYFILIIIIINSLDLLKGIDIVFTYGLISLPIFFYSLFFETLLNGQTPGKIIMGIRVVKIDGSKPYFGNFLLRWVLRIIDIDMASGSIAVFTILFNGKGQRLGDIAAGTTVITLKQKMALKHTLNVDLPDNYVPTYPQVTLLSDKDIQTIKNLYHKAIHKENQDHNIILKLHAKVIDLTGIKTEQKPFDFIKTILKDFNYYTQNG